MENSQEKSFREKIKFEISDEELKKRNSMTEQIENVFRNFYDIINPDLRGSEVVKKAHKFIEKNGGIERFLKTTEIIDMAFEKVKNVIKENENTEYFEKKKRIEPLLKEFFQIIKEKMTPQDSIIYRDHITQIAWLLRNGTEYPFLEEIGKEEKDGQPEFLKRIIKEVRNEGCSNSKFFHNRCMDCQRIFNEKIKEFSNIERNISFDTQNLGLPCNQHVFNIIQYEGRQYLIDPTYIQFCSIGKSQDILGVPNMIAGSPGMYLMNSPEQIEFLKGFIRNGFFEITNENIKMYMDSLVLSNRNANYYLNHPEASTIKTVHTGEEYIDLLINGKQICFGSEEELGIYDSLLKIFESYEKEQDLVEKI